MRLAKALPVARMGLTVVLVSLAAACTSAGSSTSEDKAGRASSPSSTNSPSTTASTSTGSTPLEAWPDRDRNGQIAFGRWLDAAQTTRAIFVIDPDGTGERQLTHPDSGVVDDQPDWSPDGSKIAFEHCAGRCEVWTINADGSGAKRLGPNCLQVGPPACEDRSAPAWSPDGKTLAVNRAFGPVTNDQIKYSQLALIDARTGRLIRTIYATAPYSGDTGEAGWSPDARRLVLGQHNSSLGKPPGGLALFVINSDSTGLRQLTHWRLDAGDHANWSPDGKLILFRTVSADEVHGNIYTIHPDGTGLHQLTHYGPSTIVLSYSFSPDSRWITFAKSGVDGEPDIFIMRVDGSDLHPVTQTSQADSAPDWGPTT